MYYNVSRPLACVLYQFPFFSWLSVEKPTYGGGKAGKNVMCRERVSSGERGYALCPITLDLFLSVGYCTCTSRRVSLCLPQSFWSLLLL